MDLAVLRRDALAALTAGVKAVQPATLLPAVLRVQDELVAGTPIPRVTGRRVVIAIGKAAPGLAAAWHDCAPGWASETLVLTPSGVPLPPDLQRRATILRGAHPVPDAGGEAATRHLLELAAGLDRHDLLLVLLSGGSSALLAAPVAGVELADVVAITSELLRAGAPITALNTVRHHLLAAAGGGLARTAFPAAVLTLVLSDVIGDPLPSIGSGPTVPAPTSPTDAIAVLDRFLPAGRVPPRIRRRLETMQAEPAENHEAWSRRSRSLILANNRTAVAAAARFLRDRGYLAISVPEPLTGEASVRGRQLAALAASLKPNAATAVLMGGETTVTVRGRGRGGRNQELALAAALQLRDTPADCPLVLLAAGTDGVDGFSEHAGALIDAGTCRRITAAGIDPAAALADNDSASAMSAAGDALVTGPTGTNVNDLTILLTAPSVQGR